VVLATGVAPRGELESPIETQSLATHQWRAPYVLSVNVPAATSGRTSSVVSRAITAVRYVHDGGWDYRWTLAVEAEAISLATEFRPDVIWVTFGKMEAVVAARRIAGALGVPWVLDIKDNWELYVPQGLRRVMVWRTRGWKALSVNSELIGAMSLKWQRARAQVVYSGVDDAFLARELKDLPKDRLDVNLIGGLYFEEPLRLFLRGVDEWSKQRDLPAHIRYAGVDEARFSNAASGLSKATVQSVGYVSLERMADMCANAHLNAYVAHPVGFHHKLLELACVGRPLLACPAEDGEARKLTKQVGVHLYEASSEEQLHRAFDEALTLPGSQNAPRGNAFRWSAQAHILELLLERAVRET
jgi:hypothetical protein